MVVVVDVTLCGKGSGLVGLVDVTFCGEGSDLVGLVDVTLCGKGSGLVELVDVGGFSVVFVGIILDCSNWDPKPSLSVNIIWSPSEMPHSVNDDVFGFVIVVGGKFAFTIINKFNL